MRNLIITFVLLGSSLVILTLFVGVTKIQTVPSFSPVYPHLYDATSTSIGKIKLTVFYFIPKDTLSKKQDSWKEITEPHLKKLIEFHNLQLRGRSEITYEFSPTVIIGNKNSKEYESLFEHDDHQSLVPVEEEIRSRVFEPTGDLYIVKTEDASVYQVYLVIFEGNGAAGNDRFSLISRSYLTDPMYKEDSSTFLAHEFYHTLGLPDNYKTAAYVYKDNQQTNVSILTKKDIMGQVNIPLQYSYIDGETLKHLGF